jgi:hypothetical protein
MLHFAVISLKYLGLHLQVSFFLMHPVVELGIIRWVLKLIKKDLHQHTKFRKIATYIAKRLAS